MAKYITCIVLTLAAIVGQFNANAQVTVTNSQTAVNLAQTLAGTGVIILNPTLNCSPNANGIFSGPNSTGLDDGIVLASGHVSNATAIGIPNAANIFASTGFNLPGDPQLTALATVNTFDACILEFDIVPAGDTIKFDYVFGSEEYPEYACATVNDVFGFFISGPGIVGSKNIALIPGTNIPVSINSVNSGPGAFGTLINCSSMGPGSPFGAYYIDNSTSTTIVYDGITTNLQAISDVTPCDTYHLKIAIADGGDGVFDSGVFLKAGSLNSNAISITPQSGGGLSNITPYCVRGCLPGVFTFKRSVPRPTPLTIHYQIAGTATNGVDYSFIPDSVVIAPFDTVALRYIQGLTVNPATGPQNVKLYVLSPYSCGAAPTIIDSAELIIIDSFLVNITTNDTAICLGESVIVEVEGDDSLTYNWSPASTANPSTGKVTTVTPNATTTYVVSATLAGSGCQASTDLITVTIREAPIVDAGPDRVTCLGTPIQFNTTVIPGGQPYTFDWQPNLYLNNNAIPDPISNPTADVTYIIRANSGAIGCDGYDTVVVTVLPNDFNLLNLDTAICEGASVQVRIDGDVNFSYNWTPTIGVVMPNQMLPVITPDTTRTYTVVATYPGCPDMMHSFTIDVQPNPVVYIGPDREMCQFDTLQLWPVITPGSYPSYIYQWTQPTNVKPSGNSRDVFFDGQADETLVLTVTTPAGCLGFDDVNIIVYAGNFGSLSPDYIEICPNTPIPLTATGGIKYEWSPAYYLDDSTSATPVATPVVSTDYTVLVTNEHGCFDTLVSKIIVHPDGVLALPDSVVLFEGESYQMDPTGNCLYFSWFPPVGLTNDKIANPIAMPEVNTRYYVNAQTEYGCAVEDSIDVLIRQDAYVELPNAFTPGNAHNKNFDIIYRGVASLKYFRIFNRWGEQVFSTTSLEEGWDGTYKGEPQPMGVYVWIVEAFTQKGKTISKQGTVTLIR